MMDPRLASTRPGEIAFDPPEVARALEVGARAGRQRVALTTAAPVVPLHHVFRLSPEEPAYYFSPVERMGEVGIGHASRLDSQDPLALELVEAQAITCLEDIFPIGLDARAEPGHYFGGLAFGQPPPANGPWQHFTSVDFTLPRLLYTVDGRHATLTLTIHRDLIDRPETCREQARSMFRFWQALLSKPRTSDCARSITTERMEPTKEGWTSQVGKAHELLAQGILEKVVLAREVSLRVHPAPDPAELLGRLALLSPDTVRFAVRRGPTTFLGASPERLVLRRGSEMHTDALAGSAQPGSDATANELSTRDKDRREHQLVVREIQARLAEIGAEAHFSPTPSVRRLRHVWHLHTPIHASMAGMPSVLDLVRRLHPTPAVGGIPMLEAARFLRENETFARGLYAGPVGWFDARGDGEFIVALRSGLVESDAVRLFAGAGIVPGSDPVSEWEETNLKLQSLLEVLGPNPSP